MSLFGRSFNVAKENSVNTISIGSVFKELGLNVGESIKNDDDYCDDVSAENESIPEESFSDIVKRITIAEICVACGSCSQISNLIREGDDGKAIPVEPGLISFREQDNLNNLVGACPVNAIKVENAGIVSVDGKAGLEELKTVVTDRLLNYKVPFPKLDDYRFDKSEYATPTAYASGEYNYEYKSSDQAERAGLREFDRVMYSQSRAIVQQILIDYKNRKLRKYSIYEKELGNYYFDSNKDIKKILMEIIYHANIISNGRINLSEQIENFEIVPEIDIEGDSTNRALFMYQLRHLEELWFVQNVLNERESLGWFQTFIDYDDREDSRGRDVYCYKNISDVCSKFGQYLLNDIQGSLNGSDGVVKVLEAPVNKYRDKVTATLKSVVESLLSEIDNTIKEM